MEQQNVNLVPEPNVVRNLNLAKDIPDFPSEYFELELKSTKSFKEFNKEFASEFSYTAVLKNPQPETYLGHILPQLFNLFESLLSEIKQVYAPLDLVRIFITHESITAVNIIVGPSFVRDISPQEMFATIGRAIHSNNFIPADKKLQINVAAVKNLRGTGRTCITNVWGDLKSKKCIIAIKNTDHLCLPRAIAVGIAHLKYKRHPKNRHFKSRYEGMRKGDQGCLSRNTTSLQKNTALEYLYKCDLSAHREGLLQDIPIFENLLKVGISVISSRTNNKRVYNANKKYKEKILLYHIVDHEGCGGGHFAVITSVSALLMRAYYCESCDVGYSNRDYHRCENWCNLCFDLNCSKGNVAYCGLCYAPCKSELCLRRHKAKLRCSNILFCQYCHCILKGFNRPYRNPVYHICGESFCRNCNCYHKDDTHRCYMRATPSKTSNASSRQRFIFYDFECMQEGESEHIPNLVVSHSICYSCDKVTSVLPRSKCDICGSRCKKCWTLNASGRGFAFPPCPIVCGYREVIFKGVETAKEFCEWLIHRQHKNVIVIAHNAKAYDSYFIYNYLIANSIKPEIIFQGSKIMYCRIASTLNIKLLDSVNFLPMPLAELPGSFGLNELKKGYFPHLYNDFHILDNPEKQFLTRLPDISYYAIDNMTKVKREEFLRWYERNENEQFDFQSELLEYCRSDVNILLNACWKFRRLVLQVTEERVDPFTYVTIASVCMGIFRTLFLPEEWKVLKSEHSMINCSHQDSCDCSWTLARKLEANGKLELLTEEGRWEDANRYAISLSRFVKSPIGLLPPHGYGRKDIFSKECAQWIYVYEKTHPRPLSVRSALSDKGEKKFTYNYRDKMHTYYVDGYYRDVDDSHHVLEFYGCYFHGCKMCYPQDRDKILLRGKSMECRYNETTIRETHLRNMGLKIHSIWSCQYQRMLSVDREWQSILLGYDVREPIDMRDCYYGGRTNALLLTKMCRDGEKVGYCDFCSLYPYSMKNNVFPQDHPIRIVNQFDAPISVVCEGGCRFLHLCPGYHISLPYFGVIKAKILPPRKLLHPVLPVRCLQRLMFPLCQTCAENEQQDHSCTCQDSLRMLTGMWCTPEVDNALTLGYKLIKVYEILHWEEKTDNLFSSYINTFLRLKTEASGYPSGVDEEEYVKRYARREGIHLQPSRIEKNPGLRSLAKLALNSFYGKFGQRQNMKKCQFVTSPTDLYQLLGDPTKTITDFHVLSSSMMTVEYRLAREFHQVDPKTSVGYAAFCSAYSRAHLLYAMIHLGSRVLYHDTDSLIYSYLPHESQPQHGEFLGDLTDELVCKKIGCEGCDVGHWIVDFVSCGPKNYAYKLNTGQVFCKVRGFSLNFEASKVVNIDSMKEALMAWHNQREPPNMVTTCTMILRNKHVAKVYTKKVGKHYGVVYNKRRVLDDMSTQPYGY